MRDMAQQPPSLHAREVPGEAWGVIQTCRLDTAHGTPQSRSSLQAASALLAFYHTVLPICIVSVNMCSEASQHAETQASHLQGVAQQLCVVHAQVGDPSHWRGGNAVGGIEPAPQAHLQNGYIHLLLQEHLQRCPDRPQHQQGTFHLQTDDGKKMPGYIVRRNPGFEHWQSSLMAVELYGGNDTKPGMLRCCGMFTKVVPLGC